ncbi:MAG TPA: hypothetical protein VFA03_08445 [Acetobacteraceae bacterium]|nr:hypothetical protein [Acetobacteraceae bacterium]
MRTTGKITLAVALAGALGLTLAGRPAQSQAVAMPGFAGSAPSSVSGCPYIGWRLVRHPDGQITGIAYYGDLTGLSEVTGHVEQDGTFHLTTKSMMGNGPVGTVDGKRTAKGADATMKGEGCANMHVRMAYVANMSKWNNANSFAQ